MYGMDKTTVYLPSELKSSLAATAKRRGVSEAELIRERSHCYGRQDSASTDLPLFR
jgi:hypothetical protein